MKSSYEARAMKFAQMLCAMFVDCTYLGDFVQVIESYNECHTRQLKYANGVSRIVLIRSDYVVKIDYTNTADWSRAGNNNTEYTVYERAVRDGYEHLLAKPTPAEFSGRKVTIMPRISGIDKGEWWWSEHCTMDEQRWLWDNIGDLHDGNLGYRRGKVCVVDYAWDDGDE